jgi:branched-chain amino acid aminotransferase
VGNGYLARETCKEREVSMLYKYCFVGTEIVNSEKAFVHADDLAVLRGFAIFDFLRTYNGRPFLLDNYLERFFNSADKLGLEIPFTKGKIAKIIHQLLDKNKISEAGIRMILTGGRSEDSFSPGKPTLVILIEHLNLLSEVQYRKGIKLITSEHLRELPHVKTTNYLRAIFLQKEKRRKKADDILYTYNNKVLECTRTNFFIVRDNTLVTPENNILKGVTRQLVLKLAKRDYNIEVRDLHCYELKSADEAFVCGTSKMLIPVVKIDGLVIGSGKPGKITLDLLEKLKKVTGKN